MKLVAMQKPEGGPMQRVILHDRETREGYAPNHVLSADKAKDEYHIGLVGPVTYSLELDRNEAEYVATILRDMLDWEPDPSTEEKT